MRRRFVVFFAPAVATPLVLLLEIAASCALLPGARREIDRRFLLAASVGIAVGSPFGIWILAHAPPAAMRAGVCALVAVLALIILRPPQKIAVALAATPPLIVGLLAGIANGAAALAGLVAVVFLLSSRRDAAQIRATLIALFLFSDIWATVWNGGFGLLQKAHIPLFVVCAPVLFVGVFVGARIFRRAGGEKSYRVFALSILLAAAVVGLARALLL